jgi:hypothetical protein
LEDAREHLVTIPDEKSRIDFLMQNLISLAKDEIRLRPLLERDTADKILYLIHSIYDGDDSVTQLQELFFRRNQKVDETLQDYSLNLMKIFDQIIKRDNTVLGDKDKVLKDRFIEGIKEPHLKREVKRFSFEHKTMKFLKFRQEVLLWVNENTQSWKVKLQMQDVGVVSDRAMQSEYTSNDNSEILKLLTKQQEMLDKQQKQIDRLSKAKNYSSSTSSNTYSSHKSESNTNYQVTCYKCGGKGH